MKKDSVKPSERGEHELLGHPPQVVVKFHDDVKLPYEDGVEKYIEELQVGPSSQLIEQFPGITFKRLYTTLDPEKIKELTKKAVNLDKTYSPRNLLTYFVVDCPPGVDPERLAEELSSWPTVQTAYFDRPAPDPVVNAADDPHFTNQGYLNPAPQGIDAEYAWPKPGGTGFPGGDGAGQHVIDMERGWTLNHEDLADHHATLLHGTLLNESRDHGTAVLGEICAVDNTIGCVGITPNVAAVNVVSYHGSTRPDAIMAAVAHLSFGDVLLLEAQVWVDYDSKLLGPIEAYDGDFEAIRLATALGIVVVEAGGNGTNNGLPPALNLDTYRNPAGKQILNRDPANPDFRDSGAIIVTAATSTTPHRRLDYAPYGNRIDCYAWGQNIYTCGSDGAGATDRYRPNFGGTSGASPIITGAALAVQGMAEALLGYRFSPLQLRAILSDPATGTRPAGSGNRHIGVMPNLRAIIERELTRQPDIYIRDNVQDTGDPHTGAIATSPDIILLHEKVADPQGSFGEGSGTENNITPGKAEAGQDNYIYVRVRNRGQLLAKDVEATVYWSEVGTLITPDLWNLVGSTTIPRVPHGNVLTVSDSIVWDKDEIPGLGHYCFVGIIGNAEDPAPNPADFSHWDKFCKFIRENNNVTWHNFNVVDNEPDPEVDPEYVVLPFLAPGALDKTRQMQLEIGANLPKGARIWFEARPNIIDGRHFRERGVDRKRDRAQLQARPQGSTRFKVRFPARSKTRSKLRVYIPEEKRGNEYEVFVRQLYRGEEIGRVTWHLAPKTH